MRERVQAELDLIESGEYHRWLSVMNSHHGYVRDIFDFMPRESRGGLAERSRQAGGRGAGGTRQPPRQLPVRRRKGAGRGASSSVGLWCAVRVWGAADGFFSELVGECESLDLVAEAADAAAMPSSNSAVASTDYAAIATDRRPGGRRAIPIVRPISQWHRSRPGRGLPVGLAGAQQHRIAHVGAGRADSSGRIVRDECIDQLKHRPPVHGRGSLQLPRLESGRDRSNHRRRRRRVLRYR